MPVKRLLVYPQEARWSTPSVEQKRKNSVRTPLLQQRCVPCNCVEQPRHLCKNDGTIKEFDPVQFVGENGSGWDLANG
jgi:hypothetical protein